MQSKLNVDETNSLHMKMGQKTTMVMIKN